MTMLSHQAYEIRTALGGVKRARSAGRLQECVALFGKMLARQRQRRVLLGLDERMLKDIGVSRQEALDEARKPFWR